MPSPLLTTSAAHFRQPCSLLPGRNPGLVHFGLVDRLLWNLASCPPLLDAVIPSNLLLNEMTEIRGHRSLLTNGERSEREPLLLRDAHTSHVLIVGQRTHLVRL